MFSADLYTKFILTVIAGCLLTLCLQGAHWNRLETVQAQSPQQVLISGYVWDKHGVQTTILLGDVFEKDHNPAIPVFIPKSSGE